jgi:hypothetical protein
MNTGDTVSTYRAGLTYRVAVKVFSTVSAPRYGFQATALDSANADIGQWLNPGTNVQVSPITINCEGTDIPRTYVEHTQASFSKIFLMGWRAPDDRADSVFFYVNGNAVNGNGGTSGDRGGFGSMIAMPGMIDTSILYTYATDSIKGEYFATSAIVNQGTVYPFDTTSQVAGDSLVFLFPFTVELGGVYEGFLNAN